MDQAQSYVNVGPTERWLSAVAGGLALAGAARSRGASAALLGVLGGGLLYRGATGHCPMNAAIGRDTAHGGGGRETALLSRTLVRQEPQVLYRYWRSLNHLPEFMSHLREVRVQTDTRSHWIMEAPGGRTVEWDAEITDDVPNERIAWRSVDQAAVEHHGEVRFRAVPEGTEVEVEMYYRPALGAPAGGAGKLFRAPAKRVLNQDLERFKRTMESGSVPTASLTTH